MNLDVNAMLEPLIWALIVASVVGMGIGVIRDILSDASDGCDDDGFDG